MLVEEFDLLRERWLAQGRKRFPDWDQVMSSPLAFDVDLSERQIEYILRQPDGCVISYHMMKRKLVGLDP